VKQKVLLFTINITRNRMQNPIIKKKPLCTQLYLRDLYLGTYYLYYMFWPIWAILRLLHAIPTDPSLFHNKISKISIHVILEDGPYRPKHVIMIQV
jgi:hypothetical protein